MAESKPFSKLYLFYALLLIFFANFLDYLDRTVVLGLELQVEATFHVRATHFGLLWTAFTLGYMIFSPVVGYLADRVQRMRLFAGCIFIWSVATAACGLTDTYWIFLVNRLFVGIGEAGAIVIGAPLVADFFSRDARGKALSVFYLGMPLGGAAGFIVAGQFGWPNAFFVAGIPGCLLAVAIYFLREPPRGASEGGVQLHGTLPPLSLKSYTELLKTRTLRFMILAQAFAAFVLVPVMAFSTSYFEGKGVSKKEVTTFLGILVIFGGILGTTSAGFIGDRLRKWHPGCYALLAGGGYMVAMPCVIFGVMLYPLLIGRVLLFFAFTSLFWSLPLLNTQIANVVHPAQRSVAFAAALFIVHILGDMPSTPLFGLVKEMDREKGAGLAFTLFPLLLILSVFFCYKAFRSAQFDVDAVSARLERDRTKIRPAPKKP